MLNYSRSHLADHVLHSTLAAVIRNDRCTTVEMLALIAEVDGRHSYRALGYDSLAGFLVDKLGMSEDMVYKRIGAARAAREYPALFAALADGRMHVTGILMLRPLLNSSNAADLIDAAAGKSREQIELLLASRFPKADVPTTLSPVAAPTAPSATESAQNDVPSLAITSPTSSQAVANTECALAPERVAPERSVPIVAQPVPPAAQRRVAPLSPGRFELRLTISQALHDKLRRAQELLSHAVPSGDIPALLERALDELIAKQEKALFAATDKPRASRKCSRNPRHIPAAVKRQVRTRDHGRCTFVSDDGHRCEARKLLQYDHVSPVARGGSASADNLRLRCRAHNQLEAERVFGAGFMREKRGYGPSVQRA